MNNSTSLKILVLEDNLFDYKLIENEVLKSFPQANIVHAKDESQIINKIKNADYDIILSDHNLNTIDSFNVIDLLKAYNINAPLIVISGIIGEETAIEIIKYGANDYLLKDRLKRLGSAIEKEINDYKIKRKLKESEDRYKLMYENTNLPMATVSLNFKILSANKAYCEMLGYSEAELKQKSLIDITHPEILEFNLKKQNELKDGKISSFQLEKTFIHKNGSTKIGILNASLIRDINGNPSYFLGNVVDITEKRSYQDILEANEAELKAIYENAPLIMLLVDEERRIVKLNNQAMLMSGSNKNDAIGNYGGDVLRCIHSLDHPKGCGFGEHCQNCEIKNTVLKTFETKETFLRKQVKFSYNHSEGIKELILLLSTKYINVSTKQLVLITIEDISEQKKAEIEIKILADKWSKTFDSINDSIFIVDINGAIKQCNQATFSLFNREKNDVIGKNCCDLIFDYGKIDHVCPLSKMKKSLKPEFDIYKYYEKWIKASVNPYLNENKELIGAVYVISDITQEVLAKKEIQKANERYSLLFNNMTTGFSFHKMVYDENDNPIDYEFIDVNPAFEKMTGLKLSEIIGKKVTQIFPGIENDPANWIQRYGNVASTQESLRFEDFSQPLSKWFSVNAYSPKKGFFATIFEDITEQKLASLLLKESREQYKAIVENSHDAIYIYQNNHFIFVNNQLCQLSGYTHDEVMQMNIWDFIHNEDKERVINYGKLRAAGKEVPNSYQARVVCKNGEIRESEFSVSIINFKGEFAVLGAVKDISDRIKSEQRYEFLFNNTGTITCIVENDKTISLINPEFERALGYTRFEIENKIPFTKLIHPEDLQMMVKNHEQRRINPDSIPKKYEFRVRAKNGNYRIMHLNVDMLPNTTQSIASMIDITDIKNIEKELHESKEKYKTITESTIDVIYMCDLFGKILYVNKQNEIVFGRKAEDVIGTNISKYSPLDESIKNANIITQLARGKIVKNHKSKIYHSNGTLIPVEINGQIVKHKGKRVLIGSIRDIREQLENQQALRESEEKFRRYIQASPTAVFIANDEGRYIFVNEAACNMLGYSEKELLKKKIPDLTPKHLMNVGLRSFIDVKTKGKSRLDNFQLIKKDETCLDIILDAVKLDENNSIAFCVDVSAQKQSEKALKESEEKFRMYTENANDVIWTANLEMKFLYVSPSVERLRGFTPEEVMNQKPSEALTKESLNCVQVELAIYLSELSKGIKNHSPKIIEIEQPCKDGSTVWTEAVVNTVFDEQGTFKFFLGVSRNINERKLNQIELNKAHNQLKEERAIFMVGDVVIFKWLNEPGFPVEYVSSNVENVFGYNSQDFVSRKIMYDKIIHPDDLNRVSEEVFKATKSEVEHFKHEDYRIISKEGEIIWLHDFTTIIKNKKGKVEYYYGYVMNVNDRKKTEQKMLKINQELSVKNKELQQFSYVTTHDMRSSILNLKGLIEVLEKRKLINDENRNIMLRVKSSVDNLYETLHDLIGLIEYQKSIDDSVRSIKLSKVISKVIQDLQIEIENENAKITYDFSEAPIINYIPGHIRSIVQNLITNAIKHRYPNRQPEIYISSKKVNDYILISVKDNGMGIKPEHQERIFELFKKINLKTEGKGIGLFVTKSQIESKGGKIELESEFEKGSIFKVYLKDITR